MPETPDPAIVSFIHKHPKFASLTITEVLSELETRFPGSDVDDFSAALIAAGQQFAHYADAIREFVAAREQDLGAAS